MIDSTDSPRHSAFTRHRLLVFGVVAVVIVGLVAARVAVEHSGSSTPGAATAGTAVVGGVAPTGPFTTVTDKSADLSSYIGGRPTMVWFLATGCSSCAASVPAVAQHLSQLAHDQMRIVVLDLYGDLGPGRAATSDLADFGRATAGPDYANQTWTWGLASQSLSYAYDPTGTPDQYFLVGSNGRVYYQNSVPVTTMEQLLTEAGRSRR